MKNKDTYIALIQLNLSEYCITNSYKPPNYSIYEANSVQEILDYVKKANGDWNKSGHGGSLTLSSASSMPHVVSYPKDTFTIYSIIKGKKLDVKYTLDQKTELKEVVTSQGWNIEIKE